ncbi:hypothetical protein JL721_9593 [Aureococcus anophagefferens]|nr:hypothetical protein JL721_9593 [Aureococcus anophagefferens]
MQRKFYDPAAQELVSGNHVIHNDAAEYWGMIPAVVRDPRVWREAPLDVACGGGRNMANLLRLAAWDRVDGCDWWRCRVGAFAHICVSCRPGILEDILGAAARRPRVAQMVRRAPHEAPLDPARRALRERLGAAAQQRPRRPASTDLGRVVEDLEDIGFVDVEYEVGGWHLGYVVSYPDQWLIVCSASPAAANGGVGN